MKDLAMRMLAMGCAAGIASLAAGQPIYYVDASAPPGGDGLSWATAFQHPQPALDALPDERVEIWVAGGVYYPSVQTDPLDPRSAVIVMRNRHALYGGFAGDETSRSQRDPGAHPTVFSGDIGEPNDPDDNAYHVVLSRYDDRTTVLDGVTVRDGNSGEIVDRGGGMLADQSSIQIRNCIFEFNRARYKGAAMYLTGSSNPVIVDTVVRNNVSVDWGGAICSDAARTLVARCRFENNQGGPGGGGLRFDNGDHEVIDCEFIGNHAGSGAGMSTDRVRRLVVSGCRFEANEGLYGNAAAFIRTMTGGLIERCDFVDNVAVEGDGGALSIDADMPFWIRNCSFLHNSAGRDGGAIFAVLKGGGVFGCLFAGNTAARDGGAIHINARVLSSILASTVFGNSAGHSGGGYFTVGLPADAQSFGSIYWANSDASGDGESAQLGTLFYTPVVNSCCIQGWTGAWGGSHNFGDDPLLTDPEGGDFHLVPGSPCIDAGDNNAVPSEYNLDLMREPRFVDDPATPDTGFGAPPLIDLGAIEFQATARPFVLAVSGSCLQGSPMLVSWAGAAPGSHVVVLYAATQGAVYVPTNYPCPGTSLQLGSARLTVALDANSDELGQRTLLLVVPRAACGGYLQALDLRRCWTSNVAALP